MGKRSGARRDELPGMGGTPSLPGPQPAPRADQREPRAAGSASATRRRYGLPVWRILTPEQVRQKFRHLSKRPTPARDAPRRELRAHIAEIHTEQEKRNAALHKIDHSHIPPLRIADRYAAGISRTRRHRGSDDSSDERRRASRPGCGDPHAVTDWRDGGGRPQAGLGDAP
jgi:hypothetical protein